VSSTHEAVEDDSQAIGASENYCSQQVISSFSEIAGFDLEFGADEARILRIYTASQMNDLQRRDVD
jgi:hypothetical protein